MVGCGPGSVNGRFEFKVGGVGRVGDAAASPSHDVSSLHISNHPKPVLHLSNFHRDIAALVSFQLKKPFQLLQSSITHLPVVLSSARAYSRKASCPKKLAPAWDQPAQRRTMFFFFTCGTHSKDT